MCEELRKIYTEYLKNKLALMDSTLDKIFENCCPEDGGAEEAIYTLSEAMTKVKETLNEINIGLGKNVHPVRI